MRRSLVLAVALLFCAGASARADFVPWSYSFSASPLTLPSDDGTASVVITPTSAVTNGLDNKDNVVAASFWANGPATAAFTGKEYDLTMHLTDGASKATGDLTFKGTLSGTTFDLSNPLTPPTNSLVLGGNSYTVTVGAFAPPAPGVSGTIRADVLVVAGSGQPEPPATVPEPGSFVLMGLGLSALGARCWRRRRTARA